MSENSFSVRDREARIGGGRSGRSFNRNKDAKYKFLADSNGAPFQRGTAVRRSLPGKSRIDLEAEEEEFKNIDLSIPGTPVSSRHVMALKYRNKLAEQDKLEREKNFEEQLSDEDPLKKFLESMKALNAKKSAESSIVVEVPLKPVLQRRNSYGYNNIGTWNSPSNLQGYTVLFQRSMSAKVDYDQQSSASPNLQSDTTNGNLMDEPDDKIDLVDENNGNAKEISTKEEPKEIARENKNTDKEAEKIVESKPAKMEPTKYIDRVENGDQRVTGKPKSKDKDKSKNKYLNFWRKLTGGKEQENKGDTRN